MKRKRGNKKAQTTIFIIIGIAIVVAAVLLIWKQKIVNLIAPEPPLSQVKKCIQEPIKKSLEIVSDQGGAIDPENYFLYKGNKVGYLCYTNEYYKTCTVQVPFVDSFIEKQILKYSEPRIKSCIKGVEEGLRKKGYDVSSKTPQISIEFLPHNIIAEADMNLVIKKKKTLSYPKIKVKIPSRFYELSMIANSIVGWEAAYGDSETTTYMIYYPSIKVEKLKQSDGTTIYILTARDTGEHLMFASRSLAWPPGYGIIQEPHVPLR